MHFTKYMALKIDMESTTINAGVHKNTWGHILTMGTVFRNNV
jgi:hypothetical protein